MSVISSYSKKVKDDNNIELRGYGLHYAGRNKVYDGKIHEINLSYSFDKNMKFEEAEKVFYYLVDGLLENLNKNKSIKNYFFNYPVSYKDLYFRLNFDYDCKHYLKRDDISMIAILENKIKYFIVEDETASGEFKSKKVTQDVHVITGHAPKTRCVTKKLPEIDK
jgi:hypothetical protein